MQQLQPGTFLQGGKYRIERVLGQGGFGITYLAMQTSLLRKVAIKEFFMKDLCGRGYDTRSVEIPSTGSRKLVEQYRNKFIKEARNLARLNHPNIISVIDVFEENGSVYYVMPYLPGGSLQDYVRVHGALSEDEAMMYIRQIASALKYMHEEEHMCHYDVKPANILLDDKGNAVLIDFGISKNYDAAGNETTTTPVGLSDGYAPIEQYQQNVAEFSPASDVYALGATLYFLLHGKRPVSAVQRVSGSALLMRKSLSQDVKDIINASLKVSKVERAQSMDLFFYEPASAEGDNDSLLDNSPKTPRTKILKNILNFILLGIFYASCGFLWAKYALPYVIDFGGEINVHDILSTSNIILIVKCSIIILVPLYFMLKTGSLFEEADPQDDAIEQYNQGFHYYYGEGVQQDYHEAAKWFKKAAEQGNAAAQFGLGVCYDNGYGVSQNYYEAVKWYRMAAEQGYASAQYNLGFCYGNGHGVSQNDYEAVKWYRMAAEQGYASAQYYLGFRYENGHGVSQNYYEAVKWYRKAAEQGDAAAQHNLGVCYENGNGVRQNYSEAVKWYRKAAEQGDSDAQYNLGVCYYNGYGVPQNYSEAVKCYRKAAEQGNTNAQVNLGVCYENGNGVPQNYYEAVKCYIKAAEQGNANAQYNLGVCYENGDGVPQNYSEAVKWYRKAAEQGDANAQYKLGVCYEGGFGVTQDYSEAKKWYKKAAEQGNADAQDGLRFCNEHLP